MKLLQQVSWARGLASKIGLGGRAVLARRRRRRTGGEAGGALGEVRFGADGSAWILCGDGGFREIRGMMLDGVAVWGLCAATAGPCDLPVLGYVPGRLRFSAGGELWMLVGAVSRLVSGLVRDGVAVLTLGDVDGAGPWAGANPGTYVRWGADRVLWLECSDGSFRALEPDVLHGVWFLRLVEVET